MLKEKIDTFEESIKVNPSLLTVDREAMNPYKWALWYIKTHNHKYSQRFKRILPHIKNLDKKGFRLPSERDPLLVKNIMKTFKKIKSSGGRPYLVYSIVQYKDTHGNHLSRPIVDIGKTAQGSDSIYKFARWKNILNKSINKRLNELRKRGTYMINIRRCIKALQSDCRINKSKAMATFVQEGYFEFKLFDIAFSCVELRNLEEFWQMYINREQSLKGYNLRVNMEFNKIIGSKDDRAAETIFINKDYISSLITLGYRLVDLCLIIGVGAVTLRNHLNYYWPGMDYNSIRKLKMGDFILEMFENGYSLKEVCKNFLRTGIFKKKDFSLSESRKNPHKFFQFKQFSSDQARFKLVEWFGQTHTKLITDLYYKPLMLSLYRDGRITQQDLIQFIAVPDYNPGKVVNPVKRSFYWLQDYVLEFILEYMLCQNYSIRKIGISLGIIPPNLKATDPAVRIIVNRLTDIIQRIWPDMKIMDIKTMLKSKNFGLSSFSYYYRF